MPGKPRAISDATVCAIAEYAGLNFPDNRVPLLREQIENILSFIQQWEQELDMLNTRLAHLYRTPREVPDPLEKGMHHAAAEYGIDVRLFVELGELMLAKDYLAAHQVRTLIREDFGRALGEVDILLTPTVAAPAARRHGYPIFVNVKYPDGYQEEVFWAHCRLTMPISMAGVPTLAIPGGFSQEGLPIGLQLTGRAFDEQTVFRVAYAYQEATDWHTRRPLL